MVTKHNFMTQTDHDYSKSYRRFFRKFLESIKTINTYVYYLCIKCSIIEKKIKSHNCRQLCFSNTYNYFSLYENGADMTFLQLVQLLFKNFINSTFDVK